MGIDRKKVRSAAQKQVRKGNWQKAISEYEKLVDDDGSDVRSRLKLADLYTRVGKEDEAIDSYKAVGRHHASQDFYQKAVAVYKQAIRLQPEDGDLHRRVGEAYHRLDRLKDAAEAYRDAQRRYKKAGRREMQRKVLEELIRIDPEDVGLHIQLAECYAKEGERGRAVEQFRTAGEMLDEEGRVDDYVQVAERILYFDPDDVRVRKKAIDIYLDRNDDKRALKHLHVCFNNRPDDEEILRKLAQTFLKLDREQKAVLVFQQLAKLYRERDRTDSALRVWERILEVAPEHDKAKKAIRALGGELPGRQQPPPEQAGGRERSAGESGEIPTISEEQNESSPDTLDGVEFIDEEPAGGPTTPEPQSGVDDGDERPNRAPSEPAEQAPGGGATGTELDDLERIDLDELDEEAGGPAGDGAQTGEPERPAEPSSQEAEPIDISDSIEPLDPEADQPRADGGEELDEMVSEADVFIKYGLYDNAREVIQKILSREPTHLPAFEKRRKLYAALDEPGAEASTLVEMAEICADRPEQARSYLQEALAIGAADQRARQTAREIGVSLEQPAEPVAEPDGEIEEIEELDEIEPVEPADEQDPGEVVELDPDEVEMIDDEEPAAGQAPADGGDEFPAMGDGIVQDSEFVVDEDFDDDLDDELEAVSEDLSQETHPESAPPSADDEDPMAQTDFEEPAEGLSFTEEEVEGALSGVFDSFAEDEHDSVNLGEDDPEGDLAQVDFYIQQELYDEAIEELEQFEQANPGHPGIDKRYYQIKTARQGGPIEQNPSGSASLSEEFEPVDEEGLDEPTATADSDGVGIDSDVVNTNFELGTAYRDMGLYDEAINEFKQAIDDPDAALEARYHIAVCKAEKGDTGEAADTLSRLLEKGDISEDLRSAARDKLDELDAPRA